MTIEYDEKGKYYTDIISKMPVSSIIQTSSHLIRGVVHVRQGWRIKDELEGDEKFIAVTDASICGVDGTVLYQSAFLAVQKDQIVWMMPMEKDEKGSE